MALCVIYVASHVGSQTATLARVRDLTSYFFTALWIFVFFYGQYRRVPRFTKRRLADYLGYWQALIGFAMLLMDALFGPEFEWLAVLFAVSAVVFVINTYRSFRRNAART